MTQDREIADDEGGRAVEFERGRLIDIAAFEQPSLFTSFGLPASL